MSASTESASADLEVFMKTMLAEPRFEASQLTFNFREENHPDGQVMYHALKCDALTKLKQQAYWERRETLIFHSQSVPFEKARALLASGRVCTQCREAHTVNKRRGIVSVRAYFNLLSLLQWVIDGIKAPTDFESLLASKVFIEKAQPIVSNSHALHGLAYLSDEATETLEEVKEAYNAFFHSEEGRLAIRFEASLRSLERLNPVKDDSSTHREVMLLMRPHLEAQARVLAASPLQVVFLAQDAKLQGDDISRLELLVEPWQKVEDLWVLPLPVFELVKSNLKLRNWVEPAHLDHEPSADDLKAARVFFSEGGRLTLREAYETARLV